MKQKYPRTVHLPFSPGVSSDDLKIDVLNKFVGQDIVVTEKMDGENSTLYRDGYHARSLDSRHHPSRDWIKAFWGNICHEIPEGWRICGENLFAKHSVGYDQLESYFYGFSIWDDRNVCQSWDETVEYWFKELNIVPVSVLYRGRFDVNVLKNIANNLDLEKQEGFVVRVSREFAFNEFDKVVAKWVRSNHVQTDEHWMHSEIIPNKLKND